MIKKCYEDMKLNVPLSKTSLKITEEHEIKTVEQLHARSYYWRWSVVLFLIIMFAAGVMSQGGQGLFWRVAGLMPISLTAPFKETSKEQLPVREKKKRETNVASRQPTGKQSAHAFRTEEKQADTTEIIPPKEPKETDSTSRAGDKEIWKTVIVKQGDSFSKLVTSVYGQASENNLKLVHKHNPQIEDINRIRVGQKIIFPPINQKTENGRQKTK